MSEQEPTPITRSIARRFGVILTVFFTVWFLLLAISSIEFLPLALFGAFVSFLAMIALGWKFKFVRGLAVVFGVIVVGVIGLIVLLVVTVSIPMMMRSERQLGTIVQQAAPLLKALEKYREDYGEFPLDLGELVPKYLQQIPQTGFPRCPTFRYALEPDKPPAGISPLPSSFSLRVECMETSDSFEAFYMAPKPTRDRSVPLPNRTNNWYWNLGGD